MRPRTTPLSQRYEDSGCRSAKTLRQNNQARLADPERRGTSFRTTHLAGTIGHAEESAMVMYRDTKAK